MKFRLIEKKKKRGERERKSKLFMCCLPDDNDTQGSGVWNSIKAAGVPDCILLLFPGQ